MSASEVPLPRSQTTRDRVVIPERVAYLYRAQAEEDRGYLGEEWITERTRAGVRFLEVLQESDERVQIHDATRDTLIDDSLFDAAELIDHLAAEAISAVWLDITALAYGTWAAIVRATIAAEITITVAYTEPAEYTQSTNPLRGLRFNLSKRTTGLAPLPGFVRLFPPETGVPILVPMLGFEGDRLQRVLEETDFDLRMTFPIVGVPGFRPEYPFLSLDGNARSLDRPPLHRNIRFARANCPFEAYLAVDQLRSQEEATHVTLAPIGTKPHALGALLQALRHPSDTTIVYDHPVRSERRTSGTSSLCVYRVTEFLHILDAA
jgi:hypothetical protein